MTASRGSDTDPADPSRDDAVHALADEGDRAFHMARRVLRTAEKAGVDPAGRRVVEVAHELAMAPRRDALGQRDPRFLHPGRSALVLLLDAGVDDALLLAATVLVESEHPGLRVARETLVGRLPDEVVALRDAVPSSGSERLAEDLVAADPAVRLAALAERLDQLRHAHLWSDPDARVRVHREARDVYLPLAAMTHPGLERRLSWWIEAFARHHLS